MDLDWKPQLQRMTNKLINKLSCLAGSYATPKQTMEIIKSAVVPSIAYAFPITPCSESDLAQWDRLTLDVIKQKYSLWPTTSTAILREDKHNFGLGCFSINVEYNARCASALTNSLNDNGKHGRITHALLKSQIQKLKAITCECLDPPNLSPPTYSQVMKNLSYMIRVRQFLCIHNSDLDLTHQGAQYLLPTILPVLEAIKGLQSPGLKGLVCNCIYPLAELGMARLHPLLTDDQAHIIDGNKSTSLFGNQVKRRHIIALNKLSHALNSSNLTPALIDTIMKSQNSSPNKSLQTRCINASTYENLSKAEHTPLWWNWSKVPAEPPTQDGSAPIPSQPTDVRPRTRSTVHATSYRNPLFENSPMDIDQNSRSHENPQNGNQASQRSSPSQAQQSTGRQSQNPTQFLSCNSQPILTPSLPPKPTASGDIANWLWEYKQNAAHEMGNITASNKIFRYEHVIQHILDWQILRKNKRSSQEMHQLQYKVQWHPVSIEKWALPILLNDGLKVATSHSTPRRLVVDACCQICWEPQSREHTHSRYSKNVVTLSVPKHEFVVTQCSLFFWCLSVCKL